jgi:hypothetical protein
LDEKKKLLIFIVRFDFGKVDGDWWKIEMWTVLENWMLKMDFIWCKLFYKSSLSLTEGENRFVGWAPLKKKSELGSYYQKTWADSVNWTEYAYDDYELTLRSHCRFLFNGTQPTP